MVITLPSMCVCACVRLGAVVTYGAFLDTMKHSTLGLKFVLKQILAEISCLSNINGFGFINDSHVFGAFCSCQPGDFGGSIRNWAIALLGLAAMVMRVSRLWDVYDVADPAAASVRRD